MVPSTFCWVGPRQLWGIRCKCTCCDSHISYILPASSCIPALEAGSREECSVIDTVASQPLSAVNPCQLLLVKFFKCSCLPENCWTYPSPPLPLTKAYLLVTATKYKLCLGTCSTFSWASLLLAGQSLELVYANTEQSCFAHVLLKMIFLVWKKNSKPEWSLNQTLLVYWLLIRKLG